MAIYKRPLQLDECLYGKSGTLCAQSILKFTILQVRGQTEWKYRLEQLRGAE